MKNEQFEKMCQELLDRGYKFYEGTSVLNPHYSKGLEKREDKYGDTRTINMLIFKVWDFTQYADRIPDGNYYSLEPIVMYSRNVDERIDLNLTHPKRSIEELEVIAKKFGEWADKNIKYIES